MMRRRIITVLVAMIIGECAAITVILIFLVLNAPQARVVIQKNAAAETGGGTLEKAGTQPKITADISVSGGDVRITEKIVLKKAAGKIVLYMPASNTAPVTVSKVETESGPAEYEKVQKTNLVIECGKARQVIRLEYTIHPRYGRGTISYTGESEYLTDFLAIPAVFEGSDPVMTYACPIGDPYISDTAEYDVNVRAEKSFGIYAPGKLHESVSGKYRNASFHTEDARDFPLVLLKDADIHTIEYDKTDVTFINSRSAAPYVMRALDFATKNIGPYPYGDLLVVRAPIGQKGMEYSCMLFISGDCFGSKTALARVAEHETLHQWFYGIIGTDQLDEPFLDEGLATELSFLMSDGTFKKGYNTSFIGKTLKDYASQGDYSEGVYSDAAAWFHNIHGNMGARYYDMWQEIYKDKKYSRLYYKDLLEYMREFSGGR